MDGLVYERQVLIGAVSHSEQPFFRMAGLGEIELEVEGPETYWPFLTLKTPVEVWLDGTEGQTAVIRLISPMIDRVTQSAKIRLTLATPPPYR